MNIYIARHGETEWNKHNQVCGRTDIYLTQNGKHQAKILAEKLATESIYLIISSPLKRATQTSNIISEICNAPVVIDNRLIEQDYGIYEGADRQNPDFLSNKRNFAYVGNTSLEVRVDTYVEEVESGERFAINHAYLILVHVNDDGEPVPIRYGLNLQSEIEQAEWDSALIRAKSRKERYAY